MPVDKWHCNPLHTPMVLRNTPYIGFDNQIHWKRILVPKIISSPDSFIKSIYHKKS